MDWDMIKSMLFTFFGIAIIAFLFLLAFDLYFGDRMHTKHSHQVSINVGGS